MKIDCSAFTDDQPTSLTSLSLLSLNFRSVVNKTLSINDLIVTRDVDIAAALTETWLETSSDGQVLGELLPRGYDYINVPRRSGQRGGGLALIFKASVDVRVRRSVIAVMQLFKPRAIILRNLACLLPERKW